MKCVWDHREYHKISHEVDHELQSYMAPFALDEIIHFLQDEGKYGKGKTKQTNKQWLAARLLDKEDKKQGELWGSGKHEWLLRSLIVEVLKRSAGTFYPKGCHLIRLSRDPLSLTKTDLKTLLETPTYIIFDSNIYYAGWDFIPKILQTSDFQSLNELFLDECNITMPAEDFLEEITQLTGHKHHDIKSHDEPYCMFSSYDWLTLQAELRTKTKYLFFENETHSLESGHAGAIKRVPTSRAFLTTNSKKFHNELVAAFEKSCTMEGFLTRVKNIIRAYMTSGRHRFAPTLEPNCLVDGTRTNDPTAIEKFRTDKLHLSGYIDTRLLIWGTEQRISHYDRKSEEENSAESLSDSDDDTLGEWMSSTLKF